MIEPEGFADHGPYDVILELVGGPNLPDDLKALNLHGRIVVIGIGAGAKAEIDLRVMMGKRARIHSSTLRPRPLEEKAQTARAMERSVLPFFDSGAIQVPIAEVYPLERATDAYERFSGGGKLGKVILEMAS